MGRRRELDRRAIERKIGAMAVSYTRSAFQQDTQRLLRGELDEDELPRWKEARDRLVADLLAHMRAEAERKGTPERRFPRARLGLRAHLAGHGPAFTTDVGFRGAALHPDFRAPVRRGDPASVRLSVNGRSLYVAGRVAWCDGTRVGVRFDAIAADDELILQAAVCARLLDGATA